MANPNTCQNKIECLKIAQVNIRSLISHAKREEFRLFLRKEKPHLVLISETHLNSKHKVHFEGYNFYRNDRLNGNHGGTGICVIENIDSVQVIAPDSLISIETCNVKIETINGPILFSAIYRKPSTQINCNDLSKIIALNNNSTFVIGGDFNAHSPFWGGNKMCSNGRKLSDWFTANRDKYKMKIMAPAKPTCHSKNASSFIDFTILSEHLPILNCDINGKLPSNEIFSDHSVIFLNIACDKIKMIEPVRIKNFKKTNWPAFNKYIDENVNNTNIPMCRNMSRTEIDNVCVCIENIFMSAIEQFVPEIKIRPSRVELSARSLKIIKEKKNLLRKKYRNRNNINCASISSQLKLLNEAMIRSISDDYRKVLTHRFKSVRPDNNLFKTIKQLSSYKCINAMPATMYNDDKSIKYVSNAEKCEAFAAHFASSHNLTANSQSSMQNAVAEVNQLYENPTPIMIFSPDTPADFVDRSIAIEQQLVSKMFVSTEVVHIIIKSRNNKKSSGSDTMPNYALKKLSTSTIRLFAVLFNHITNIQYIPSNWKIASITPVPKPNKNIENTSNWRPISQISTLSKCYEKVMDNALRLECNEKELIDPCQFGFQPGCSTTHAIAKIVTDVAKGLNNGEPTMAVLIDLQSAFDVIWHDGLIFKLHKLGISPPLIALVKNYLTNRKFFVKLNKDKSGTKNIVAGTPQGSIISALLFILYLNDLPKPMNLICNIKRLLFADDIIIYTTTKNIDFARMAMNKFLNDVFTFLMKWKLKINVNKCESIPFVGHYKDLNLAIRKRALDCKFTINRTIIKKSSEVKYLGVILSQDFQFTKHVKHILGKINAALAMLNTLFTNKFVDKVVKLIMYKQLIRPLIMYASPCWLSPNVVSSYQVEQIRMKERQILRNCCSLFREPNGMKYINSKILYNEARVNRIDRELIKMNMKFIEKSKNHSKQIVRDLFAENNQNPDIVKYKPIDYFNTLKSANRLHENELLLIFNKKKFRPNESIYVQAQNTIDL